MTHNYTQSTSGQQPYTSSTPTLYFTPTGPSPHYLMKIYISNITSVDVKKIIPSAVRSIGKDKLGFT